MVEGVANISSHFQSSKGLVTVKGFGFYPYVI